MILRDFVSQALTDIVGGVQDAQTKTPSGTIMPGGLSKSLELVKAGGSGLQVVEFELTVKADEKSGRESHLSVVSAEGLWIFNEGFDACQKCCVILPRPTVMLAAGPEVRQTRAA